jgi:hypothetical protein
MFEMGGFKKGRAECWGGGGGGDLRFDWIRRWLSW